MIFERWQDIIGLGKQADAVLIGLQVGQTLAAYSNTSDTSIGRDACYSGCCVRSTRLSYNV